MSSQPLWEVNLESLDATHALAARLAALVRAGDVWVLEGELGAGKTELVRSILRQLGVPEKVAITSPTFALINEYPIGEYGPGSHRAGLGGTGSHGAQWAIHADLYRIDHESGIPDLGLTELLDEGAIAFIEWGERFLSWFSPCLLIRLELLSETGRKARFRALSDRGVSILEELRA